MSIAAAVFTDASNMDSTEELRREYLSKDVAPEALGISNIFLSGSIVHQASLNSDAAKACDWDGAIFVKTQEQVLELVTRHRPTLRKLLKIHREEGTDESWERALTPSNHGLWQIIRFSGWTLEGSKRTAKIWSLEHFNSLSQSSSNPLGVLSHKTVVTAKCNDPIGDSYLAMVPATRASAECNILQDPDFFVVPGASSYGQQLAWPGVLSDMLLTSVSLFERYDGSSRALLKNILTRWTFLNNDAPLKSLLPRLCRWTIFSSTRRQHLESVLCSLLEDPALSTDARCDSPLSRSPHNPTLIIRSQDPTASFAGFLFYPRAKEITLTPQPSPIPSLPTSPISSCSSFSLGPLHPVSSQFSRNSTCSTLTLTHLPTSSTLSGFLKVSPSTSLEPPALAALSPYFPRDKLQRLLFHDPEGGRVCYERFPGKSLLEIRFDVLLRREGSFAMGLEEGDLGRWLLSVEVVRAGDVGEMVGRTIRLGPLKEEMRAPAGMVRGRSRVHKYFFDRLRGNSRLREFYGDSRPDFLALAGKEGMGLEEFLQLPISVNGRQHGTLGSRLLRAERALDPARLGKFPVALGLGDGHGGNLLVEERKGRLSNPRVRYIDYEVVGWHCPALDLAKPVYLDCFAEALNAEILSEELTRGDRGGETAMWVDWRLDRKKGLEMEYGFRPGGRERAMAVAKLEYLVRPVLGMLKEKGMRVEESVEVLGEAFLACAILTRDYLRRADVFYLNLALGLDLAEDLKGAIERCFGWTRWPE